MRDPRVSLVIPGKNCARTLPECLDAVLPLRDKPDARLDEILFVDDGSNDDSAAIAAARNVTCLLGPAGGPGAARNVGWRAARNPLVWFIDSDCIARPDALDRLLVRLDDPRVAAVGGSYDNHCPHSLLASLIHEEIAARHDAMPSEVNFLGGFNVVYRRDILEQVGGFDESRFNGPGSPGAEDAELAYRIHRAGYLLRFDRDSRVAHHHPTRLSRYLRAQRHHGYWRVNLHLVHPIHAGGDNYSSLIDNIQPPLAMASLATLPLAVTPLNTFPIARLSSGILIALLVLAQLPMTARLLRRTGNPRMIAFAPLSILRAFARGLGMTHALLRHVIPHA